MFRRIHGVFCQTSDIEEEDLEKAALKNSIRVSLSRQRDETFAALAFAAKAGDVETVRQLLRRGAEINAVDYDGRSVLAMVRVRVMTGKTVLHLQRIHSAFLCICMTVSSNHDRRVMKATSRWWNSCWRRGRRRIPRADGAKPRCRKRWKAGWEHNRLSS
jgi:hypothetical protein